MTSFHQVLDHIRATSETEAQKGRLFERLMKTYFEQDPRYRDRFANVSLWSDWAAAQFGFDRTDIGVDLVAEERAGGYCAVQCKCYAPGTRISKVHLDSFISASARDPFTSASSSIPATSGVRTPGALWTTSNPNARCFASATSLAAHLIGPTSTATNRRISRTDGIRTTSGPWFIDRYHVKTDAKSGIVNDPNGWFDDPRDIVSAVRRIVHVSVRTVATVRSLPNPLAI